MLKTREKVGHKDQTMSQSVDPKSDKIGHNNNINNNTKAITNPLALSLLIGLKNNKCISDSDFVRSPKSPLEFRVLSTMAEPFFLRCPRSSLTAHLNCCCGPVKVGLSIVDSLADDRVLSPDIVFGPALSIKSSEIRDKHPKLSSEPKPVEIKKEISGAIFQIGETEPGETRVLSRSKFCAEGNSEIAFSCCLSEDEDEMEMSEDYTCIISHGPNPKTTHIYGGRVLECHKNEFDNKKSMWKQSLIPCFPSIISSPYVTSATKNLKLEKTYICTGVEKGFCSEECRSEEMMIDEEDMEDSCIVMQESLQKLF
ncbi:unnamed protein product [Thlaspi arvense]|uniref:FLZ-type domain-containing protein n=1 Tax=Thlaspi arvense TaxID=13288 RepID=A0AAU9SAV1_THLAR|nr:unnamed protein product [Thlaspi arvense]